MKILVIIIVSLIVLYTIPVGLYFQAVVTGVNVSLPELIRYKRRKLPIATLVSLTGKLATIGIYINMSSIVDLHEKGIDIYNVVHGLIKAHDNKLKLTFDEACKADQQNIDIQRTVINTLNNVGEKRQKDY